MIYLKKISPKQRFSFRVTADGYFPPFKAPPNYKKWYCRVGFVFYIESLPNQGPSFRSDGEPVNRRPLNFQVWHVSWPTYFPSQYSYWNWSSLPPFFLLKKYLLKSVVEGRSFHVSKWAWEDLKFKYFVLREYVQYDVRCCCGIWILIIHINLLIIIRILIIIILPTLIIIM